MENRLVMTSWTRRISEGSIHQAEFAARGTIDMIRICLVTLSVAAIGCFSGGLIATNGRISGSIWSPIIVAWFATLAALIPSIILRNVVIHNGIRHLAAIAWRFPIALLTTLLSSLFEGEQRNCFLMALVTCYLITLTLESWLQIRQVQTQQSLDA